MAPEPAQPTLAGGAPDVTPGAHHTGRRQSGWATSFEHGILCRPAHEEAVEVSFCPLSREAHGPGGSAPFCVRMPLVRRPGIPLPLALLFFRGGVTKKDRSLGVKHPYAQAFFPKSLSMYSGRDPENDSWTPPSLREHLLESRQDFLKGDWVHLA
jgi:hypothetical protein